MTLHNLKQAAAKEAAAAAKEAAAANRAARALKALERIWGGNAPDWRDDLSAEIKAGNLPASLMGESLDTLCDLGRSLSEGLPRMTAEAREKQAAASKKVAHATFVGRGAFAEALREAKGKVTPSANAPSGVNEVAAKQAASKGVKAPIGSVEARILEAAKAAAAKAAAASTAEAVAKMVAAEKAAAKEAAAKKLDAEKKAAIEKAAAERARRILGF